MEIDFGKTASDYGAYRLGFPDSLFDRLRSDFGVGLPGQRVVDLGTGTGTVARGFALGGCEVIGIDPSESLLGEARRLADGAGVAVDFRVAVAEATGLPDGWADVVAAGQCWHWFDRTAAAAEVMRVLRSGGHLVICYFDWLPLPGSVAHATEQLVLAHNPDWWGADNTGLYPQWTTDAAEAGFTDVETFSYDAPALYSHEAWRGRIRACAGVGASLPPDAVARFDADLARMLSDRFPDDPLDVPHRVWALVARRPS